MNIGKLDRLVVIKQATFTQDAYGENIASNSTLASVWARFEFEKGKAGYEADTFIGTAPAKMTIRYRSDIQVSPKHYIDCLLYTSPSPRDGLLSRMPSSA